MVLNLMAKFVKFGWILSLFLVYLDPVQRVSASQVVDSSIGGRRILQDTAEEQRQRTILLDFSRVATKNATLDTWGSSLQVCEWTGVDCDNLGRVVNLSLPGMQLAGTISPVLSDLQFLTHLDLSDNKLTGTIPDSLFSRHNFLHLNLSMNSLTGEIPPSLSNCLSLQVLDLHTNSLSGTIPASLGVLQSLQYLSLWNNILEGHIPASLGNCSSLQFLVLSFNILTGEIPSELGNLSFLRGLFLAANFLVGPIPKSIGNCSALEELHLGVNKLSGQIPVEIGRLANLQFITLQSNMLDGQIPAELEHLPHLQQLNLGNNKLSGSVLSLNGSSLQVVQLNNNSLSGEIPAFHSADASNISDLDLSYNQLTGAIPDSIGILQHAVHIDLQYNMLMGSIPSTLEFCTELRHLDLSDNQLSGAIPASLGHLKQLVYVDVSNNELEGSVPSRWDKFSASSFTGNSELCGSPTQVACDGGGSEKRRTWIYISVAIGTLAGGIVALSAAIWCTWKRKKSTARLAPIVEMSNFTDEVILTVEDVVSATNDFSEANIIGEGSKSVVYRGVLPGGLTIAVKKLIMDNTEMSANKLNYEMQLLGTLRHRNWLKVYGFFSSPEVKALVLEYAPNGSLHDQLHGSETCQLTWKMRLEIAKGIAEGLVHIHHECARPIIHLDIKPSNILLDENFVAKVADLGISKLVALGSSSVDSTTSALFGTTGYIPPEYGISPKVSTKGDVFNYGILLLELLTRKRPTFRFDRDVSLREWVSDAAENPDRMLTILDTSIQNELAVHEDQIQLMVRVGLLCTENSPAKRPTMKDVRDMLMQIESLSNPQRKGR